MLAVLPQVARQLLEAMMITGTREYRSDFARRFYGQGKAKGEAEAILTVLQARGLAVPDDVRERIIGCDDLAQLKVWIARAATATAVEDLFA